MPRRAPLRAPRAPPPAAAPAKRNPYLDLERDLLPGGAPNTPGRRLTLRVRRALGLRQLAHLYGARASLAAGWVPDEETRSDLADLLGAMAPDLGDGRITRLLEGPRAAQLVVVVARAWPGAPEHVVDPLVRELLRAGATKLPAKTPHLLAELAAALAGLGWRERPAWLAIANAARALLPPPPAAAAGGGARRREEAAARAGQLRAAALACPLEARDAALLAEAFSLVGAGDADLLEGLAAAAAGKAALMDLSDLSKTAAAFARLGYAPALSPLAAALGGALVARLAEGSGGEAEAWAREDRDAWRVVVNARGGGGGGGGGAGGGAEGLGGARAVGGGGGGGGAFAGREALVRLEVGGDAAVDLAAACLVDLARLGLRDAPAAAALDALASRLVRGGARPAPPRLAALLAACAACGRAPPRVMRRLARGVAATPAGAWAAGDAARASRALGALGRWDAAAAAALANAALASAGGGSGRGAAGARGRGGGGGGGGSGAAADAGCLADVVWGCAAALEGAGGLERLGGGAALPRPVALLCDAAAAAAAAGSGGGGVRRGAAGGLAPKQQADLIWGLRRLGRPELAQRVVAALVAPAAAGGRAAAAEGEEGTAPSFD
ncbi:MAG: hypothetical protein J3K34DRAFT_519487 [Monoraphidium minutum]|nr:MAG: hypothetical protein J3K34DRAFT_519487 [Monoraphidium minutum]